MTGSELNKWRTSRGLSLRTAAKIFRQDSHKTISNWENSTPPHWIIWAITEYDRKNPMATNKK